MNEIKKFCEIENKSFFGCWGDEFCGFDRPVWLVCKKIENKVGCIMKENAEEGMQFYVNENDVVKFYDSWENALKEIKN